MDLTLVLLRHGESVWNAEDRFAGTVDVPLSDAGRQQALDVGRALWDAGLPPTSVHCSELSRARETVQWVLAGTEAGPVPVRSAWALDERHYGALQGRLRREVEAELGAETFRAVRRSWTTRPPAAGAVDYPYPLGPAAHRLRDGESLRDVSQRVRPYWQRAIAPDLSPRSVVLVVAHGNSLRALLKTIEGVSDEAIADREIEVGRPRIYRFDDPARLWAIGEDLEVAKASGSRAGR
jgi:2,3-bisphosphoglycerate-dependent phosphoglycerate mutase